MIDCNLYEAYLLIVAERKNGNYFAEMMSHFAQIVAVSEVSNWLEKSIRPSFLIKLFVEKVCLRGQGERSSSLASIFVAICNIVYKRGCLPSI